MKIWKKIKRVIAFLAIPILLLNSVPSYAADYEANFDSLSSEIDNESVTIDMTETAATTVKDYTIADTKELLQKEADAISKIAAEIYVTTKNTLQVPGVEPMAKTPTKCAHKRKNYYSTEPSCTTGGEAWWVCKDCGEKHVYATTDAKGHKKSNFSIGGTCITPGRSGWTCTVCGTSSSSPTSTNPNNHVNKDYYSTEPSCTTGGEAWWVCRDCGKKHVYATTDAKGHRTSDFSIDGTCITPGRKGWTCTVCGASSSSPTSTNPDNHAKKKPFDEKPTCTTGAKVGWVCEDCGKENVIGEIDPLGHIHGEATCIQDDVCQREGCNEILAFKNDYHKNKTETVIREASCTQPGIIKWECADCKDKGEESIPINRRNHINKNYFDPNPTCTESAKVGWVCADCGEEQVTGELDALGHKPSVATCTEDSVCLRDGCGVTLSPALGHLPSGGTCQEPSICLREGCGVEVGPKNPNNHVNIDYKSAYEPPSCLKPGRSGWKCLDCGHFEVRAEIDALGHYFKNGGNYCTRCHNDIGPNGEILTHKHDYTIFDTCLTAKKCACGEVGGEDTIPGHDYYEENTHGYHYADFNRKICKVKGCSEHVHIYEYRNEWLPLLCVCGEEKAYIAPDDDDIVYIPPEKMAATNVDSTHSGDPVNTFTGAHEIDFNVLSVGGYSDLAIGLSYKSNKPIKSFFGKGFSWNYESYIQEKDGDIWLFHSPGDYVLYQAVEGTNYYVTEAAGSELDELYKNEDGSYSLVSKGKTIDYDPLGRIVEITEKTGENTLIEYEENQIDLIDGVSGQKISLYLNDKHLVERVSNNASADAYFEYDKAGQLIKYTDPDGFTTQYTYDKNGQVLTGTDADNNVFFEDTYDKEGRVIEQKDAAGKISVFNYSINDEGNKITEFTDRNGNTKTHVFDSVGRLLSLTDEEGNTTKSVYDEHGNCIEKIDGLSNSIQMEYDEKANLVKQTNALGQSTTFEYDDDNNVIKINYPDGSVETFSYNEQNKLVSATNSRGLETTNYYDEYGYLIKTVTGEREVTYTYEKGNLKTVTDPLGKVTVNTYDENNHLVGTKYADGAVTSQTVSAYGVVTSSTDALNNTRSNTTNCVDKPLTSVDEDKNKTTYEYDDRQLLVKTTDSENNETTYEYDDEERLIKTTYADGSFTTTTYDKTGKVVSSTDAEGNTITYEYDAAGRLIKEIDKNDNEATITYDAAGNVTSRIDRNDNTTSYTYDSMGRVITETNAFGGVTEYSYNAGGDLISVKDPANNITLYTYDIYGNRTSVTDPNGNVSYFEYDLNGNLIKSKNALGQVTTYTYDSRNRLLSAKTGDAVQTYKYDLKGQLVATTDPNGNTSKTQYDKRGLVSKTTDALDNATSFVYDSNGNLVSSTNAKGQTTTYTINKVNQVIKVTDELKLTTTFEYDKNGRRNKSTNPMEGVSRCIFDNNGNVLELIGPENGTTSFTYDANNNLTSRSTVAGNSVQYTYNALNLAASMTNARGQSTTYEYDRCGRIVKTTTPEGEISYTYDANSNVLTVTDVNGTITRTYDALNRVTSTTDTKGRVVSYSYDSYGNLQTLTYPDNTSVTYTYDLCGNIKTVTDWEGNVTSYTYDALNREIETVNLTRVADASSTNIFDLDLSKYSVWESGEYDAQTGTKADHRRRMRSPESITAEYPEYDIDISTGFKLRICEYAEDGSFLRSMETTGGAYAPGENCKSFALTLMRIEKEKSLSPGQWNRLFAIGVNVVISVNGNTDVTQGTLTASTKSTKEYDVIGNLVKTTVRRASTDEVLDETIYEYDDINRLVSETRQVKNLRYEYTYDDLSRVLSRVTKNLQTGEVTDEETFEYDGAGNITKAQAGDSDNNLSYVKEDNRIESYNDIGFSFDNDGNLISAQMGGYDIALAYDSRNHLTQCEENRYSYDAEDYRTSGAEKVIKKRVKLEGISDDGGFTPGKPNPNPEYDTNGNASDMGYESDDVSGNVIQEEETAAEESAQPDQSEDTGDDSDEEEPQAEEYYEEAPVGDTSEVINTTEEPSDVNGDYIETVEETVSEETESTSEIVEVQPIEEDTAADTAEEAEVITEVESGEEAEKSVVTGVEESDVESSFNADKGDKLTALEDADLTDDSFELNALRDLSHAEYEEYEAIRTTEFCYDRENKNLLVRYTDDGTIEKYVYGNGLIASYETYEEAGTYDFDIVINGVEPVSKTEYHSFFYDIRGSVTIVTDEAGTVTAEYSYSTYGKRTTISGNDSSVLGYCARDGVLTDVNGLLYMRARYYYPDLMRFINQDIVTGDISNSSSLNRYAYVNGNPVTLIDPFGLCAERADRFFDGLTNSLWGAQEMAMGYGAIKAGEIVMAIPLPGCRVLGGALMLAGCLEMWFGWSDSSEGLGDMVFSATNMNCKSINPARDFVFRGNSEAYYNTELALTYFNCVGTEYANTKMWAVDNSKPDIAKWADYESNPSEGENNGKVPNPYGKLGGPDHRAMVESIEPKCEGNTIDTEVRFDTTGGYKDFRYADAVERDPEGNIVEIYQVGKANLDGSPIARERRAIDDIMRSNDCPPGTPITFLPYNKR